MTASNAGTSGLLSLEVAGEHRLEGAHVGGQVAMDGFPQPRAERVAEETEAGVDPGHGRVEVDVVVLQPDDVGFDPSMRSMRNG